MIDEERLLIDKDNFVHDFPSCMHINCSSPSESSKPYRMAFDPTTSSE
jgi:hypothetical protein